MDNVARLETGDRAALFAASADIRGMTSTIVEKDFWVCWILKRVFALDVPPKILFKGGTTLSKVFRVIDRFSEDIDLSLNRDDLGMNEANTPLNATTSKERERRVNDLGDKCRTHIRDEFQPSLKSAIRVEIGDSDEWSLETAEDDPDLQTLLFRYPSTDPTRTEQGYIRPMVRLEIASRADHWPAKDATISPYAADDFPDKFDAPKCSVRVLTAERTFWEKATLLHSLACRAEEDPLKDRLSRHYYDVVQLYERGPGKAALKDTKLLADVVRHKLAFFYSKWANYPDAKPGSLRLVPPESRHAKLASDYKKMELMFFGEQPPLKYLLDVLGKIEREFNGTAPN